MDLKQISIVNFFNNLKTGQVIGLLILFGFLVYGNTFGNQLFWDDYNGIIDNRYIKDWHYFPKYFTESLVAGSGLENNYWRPLVLLTFSLDYKLGGLDPFWYHWQNLFWHLLSVSGLFLLLKEFRFSQFVSFLTALLFLVHPLQTEAVTYVSGRAEPLYLTCLFFGLLFFIKGSKQIIQKNKTKEYGFSLLLFILGLLVKERIVVLIPLLIMYSFLNGQNWQQRRKYFLLIVPFVVLFIGYIILRTTVLHFSDNFILDTQVNIQTLAWWQQILVYIKAVALSGWLIFWPNNLHMFRTIFPPNNWWDILLGSGLVGIVLFIYLGYRLRKNKRLFFFYWWIILFILPSFYTFRMHGYWGEHWLVGLLPGVFVMIFYFLEKIYQYRIKSDLKKIFFLIILVMPFIFYIIQTIKRNAEWENPIRFYEINIQRQGVGSIIYNNLGRAYFNKGEYAKAKEMYEKALEVNPTMYQAWYNLGNLYLQLAYFDKALSAYERTLAINKYFVPAYHNIAVVYDRQGKQAEAIDFLERVSREVFPIPPMGIWYDLAVFSLKDGQKEKAHYYFNKVFEKNPDDPMVKQLEELMK